MIEEAFCLLGLLKVEGSLERVARLLPPERQDKVAHWVGEFSGLSAQELRKKLNTLRDSAVLQLKGRLTNEFGAGWREIPPLLQIWLGDVLLRTHKDEDH